MIQLQEFAASELKVMPEQVQIFTPTPSTYASLMYYTEIDPFTGKKIFVEKNRHRQDAAEGSYHRLAWQKVPSG